MRKHIRLTILTGAIAFLPVFAIIAVVFQTLKSLGAILRPMIERLDIDSGLGAVLIIVLPGLVFLAFVYLLGLLARHGPVARWLDGLDSTLARRVPGYTLLKGIVTSAIDDVETSEGFAPVTVRTSDGLRPGFVVDELPEGYLAVFLPNTPNPQSGYTVIVKSTDCEPLDMSAKDVLDALSSFGRGINPDAN